MPSEIKGQERERGRQRKRGEIKCQVHYGPFCPETAAATTDKSRGAPSSIGPGKAPGIIQGLSSLLLWEPGSLSLLVRKRRWRRGSRLGSRPVPTRDPPPPVLKHGRSCRGAQTVPTLLHFLHQSTFNDLYACVLKGGGRRAVCVCVCVCLVGAGSVSVNSCEVLSSGA